MIALFFNLINITIEDICQVDSTDSQKENYLCLFALNLPKIGQNFELTNRL